MSRIRVLLADDHKAVLKQVRSILQEEFDVIGEVSNGQDAVNEARRLAPDIVVIDISMPIVDGLQAASQLHSSNCPAKILFLTVHKDKDYVAAALAAGASGYVTKSHLFSDLVPAIHEVLQGNTFISQSANK